MKWEAATLYKVLVLVEPLSDSCPNPVMCMVFVSDRLAISRLHTDEDEDDARTSEAGNLLQVLESYMHRTGARFTDVFFFLDRRVLGGKCSPDSWCWC